MQEDAHAAVEQELRRAESARTQAAEAVRRAQREIEAATARANRYASTISANVDREVQHELSAALAGIDKAEVGAAAAEAARAAEPAIESARAALAKARVSQQDPVAAPKANESSHDGDDDGDDNDADGDEAPFVMGAPDFVWNMPELFDAETTEELARLPDELKTLSDIDEDAQKPKSRDEQTLSERVRALERIAHGDKDDGSHEGESLEERVTRLEKLLGERERAHGRSSAPRAQSGPKYKVITPDQKGWGSWPKTPAVPHVAPDQPATPAPPAPPAPHSSKHAQPHEAPNADAPDSDSPRAVIRVPRIHGDGYEIYRSTPDGGGKWTFEMPKNGKWNGDITPEAREKIERGMEKAQRALEKARVEGRVQAGDAKRLARDGVTLSAQSRKELESLMHDMRGQMDAMREEMTRLRTELERMPRNEAR